MTQYYPAYKVQGTWYRFSQRGQDVAFSTETEAKEYLNGVVGETRIDVEVKGTMNQHGARAVKIDPQRGCLMR